MWGFGFFRYLEAATFPTTMSLWDAFLAQEALKEAEEGRDDQEVKNKEVKKEEVKKEEVDQERPKIKKVKKETPEVKKEAPEKT